MLRRDWMAARAKCDREGCRICGKAAEAAHVIGRSRDKRGDGVSLVVNPDSIVPLCRAHHQAYDARQLDLAPYLKPEEGAQAVLDAGSLHAALRRITPRETP